MNNKTPQNDHAPGIKNMIELDNGQIGLLLKLVDNEIKENIARGDDAYNIPWEHIKVLLGAV